MDWCVENEIKHVFCGNPEGVERNTSGRKKKNRVKNKKKIRKRKVSQKLSNWNFGKMMEILEYKLNAQNIKFEKIIPLVEIYYVIKTFYVFSLDIVVNGTDFA